jgi:acetoin utilization protein AcuA
MQIDVWSAQHPPGAVRPAQGFAAIVSSQRLEETVHTVIGLGGWVIAATIEHELVGYASILRPTPTVWMGRVYARRWDDVEGLLELGALEVARPFRSSGVGRLLVEAIEHDERLDEAVLFGIGVVHHWDLGWSQRPPFVQRHLLAATLRYAGMIIRPTDDPEVTLHPANALFARMGSRAAPALRAAFEARL